jgi:hypothetical protein
LGRVAAQSLGKVALGISSSRYENWHRLAAASIGRASRQAAEGVSRWSWVKTLAQSPTLTIPLAENPSGDRPVENLDFVGVLMRVRLMAIIVYGQQKLREQMFSRASKYAARLTGEDLVQLASAGARTTGLALPIGSHSCDAQPLPFDSGE